jgi:hypothetical protein
MLEIPVRSRAEPSIVWSEAGRQIDFSDQQLQSASASMSQTIYDQQLQSAAASMSQTIYDSRGRSRQSMKVQAYLHVPAS